MTVPLLLLAAAALSRANSASANAFVHPIALSLSITPSAAVATTTMMASPPQHRPTPKLLSTPVPPPPPVSMPVWSLTCPVPFPLVHLPGSPASSMSILTFVTPVSVSSPKLWALSLYRTTLTRCAFLGVPTSGEEYNDIPSISSSATTTPGSAFNVRRRDAMGEPGILGAGMGGEAVGWRARRRAGEGSTGGTGGSSAGSVPAGGTGILQLLSPNQARLVRVLGKRTGWDGTVDKREECAALGNDWATVVGSDGEMRFVVLPNCASYLQVKLRRVTDGGDHDVAICEVAGTGVWDDGSRTVLWLSEGDAEKQSALDPSSVLYSGQLRMEGVI